MAPPPHRVFVTALRLADFRNHATLSLTADRRSVVLLGENGAGKTNVLEALSLLSPGRGLRRAQRAEIARQGGTGGYAVSADVDGAVGPVRIAVAADPDEPSRRLTVDGERQKSLDVLSDHLRVLWLTPAMDGLFTGPAGDRRRFLDRMVLAIDPAHGRRVVAFEQALTQRNRLLEDLRPDPVWLDGVETQIAGLGVAVAAARREMVGCLARLIGDDADAEPGKGAPFPTAAVALDGEIEAALERTSASDVEDWYRTDLGAGRSRDRAAGRTLSGPHRTDLVVLHAAKAMPAALSSTGEQKALLIGLILAQARLVAEMAGMTPVLLLDEVAAHLDPARRAGLFARLDRLGCQAFLTGADRAAFAALGSAAAVVELVGLSEGGGMR
ncbi:MAG TPA: DNA replication/repair protein RecF [Methylomirabilota bacterium]|nr:DNA replication/repair protein RecF [Methylomirabilota bacterium]